MRSCATHSLGEPIALIPDLLLRHYVYNRAWCRAPTAAPTELIGPTDQLQDHINIVTADHMNPRLLASTILLVGLASCSVALAQENQQAPVLSAEPVMRYSAPAIGVADATLWCFTSNQRPVLILKVVHEGRSAAAAIEPRTNRLIFNCWPSHAAGR